MSKKREKEEQTLEEKLKLAIVPKEEEPYRVPDNWVWTRLGNIADKITDGAHKTPTYTDSGVPFISVKDIRDNKIYFDDTKFISEEEHKELYKRCNPEKGDVLVTKSGTIGRTAVIKDDTEFSLFVSVALIKNKKDVILSDFLSYAMKDYINKIDISNDIKGGVIKNYHISDMKEQKIPLPPIEEQKRIVNKLDYFFDKIQKVKEIIEEVSKKNEARKESILSKAFTGELTAKWRADNIHSAKELLSKINDEKLSNWEQECQKAEAEGRKKPTKPKLKSIDEMIVPNDEIPYRVPDNWIWTRLGDISEVNPKKVSLSYDDEEQISFVPMKAVSEITGKIEDLEFERYGKLKKGYTQFIEEDVLFAKITPCMENGKCAIAKNLKDKIGYGTTEFHVLRTNKYFDNRFLFNFLRQESFRKDAQYHMTGSVGFRRVPTEYLKEFVFPLPPIEEQKEIVRILDNIFTKENLINELISLEDKIQALEKSILSKAFRGELGTNSKDDIEAMELLKEIL